MIEDVKEENDVQENHFSESQVHKGQVLLAHPAPPPYSEGTGTSAGTSSVIPAPH